MAAFKALKEILRDYRHAEYTFRSNNFQYAPRFKFLFHVYFDIDPDIYFAINIPPNPNLGLTVKTVKLPQYTMQTYQMNQYNRKRIVNTKIKYDPINITLHDDNSNAVRNMWYNYYSYYFDDPNNTDKNPSNPGSTTQNTGQSVQTPISYNFTDRNQYKPREYILNQSWGYVGEGDQNGVKKPFFRSIVIYGFNQKTYVAYTLINPVITSFQHDTYSYADGAGIMENTMGIDYEFVKYDTGAYNGEDPSAMVLRFAERPGNYDFGGSPNRYGDNASDATTLNRERVPNTGNQRESVNGLDLPADFTVPDYSGYRTPSGDPYHSGDFLPSNADNNTYKNQPNVDAARAPLPQQALQQALEATSPRSLRNQPFSTPAYGSTPGSIGVAGSTVNPNISPNSDAFIVVGENGGIGGP